MTDAKVGPYRRNIMDLQLQAFAAAFGAALQHERFVANPAPTGVRISVVDARSSYELARAFSLAAGKSFLDGKVAEQKCAPKDGIIGEIYKGTVWQHLYGERHVQMRRSVLCLDDLFFSYLERKKLLNHDLWPRKSPGQLTFGENTRDEAERAKSDIVVSFENYAPSVDLSVLQRKYAMASYVSAQYESDDIGPTVRASDNAALSILLGNIEEQAGFPAQDFEGHSEGEVEENSACHTVQIDIQNSRARTATMAQFLDEYGFRYAG